ncbi:cytochrome P450 [Microbacterium sp. X-17]|uniref:cytochrome P450 n=1 Tax=Microbacterium sp. X-17 TaxID=3144404 RepID=UPI0031F4A050
MSAYLTVRDPDEVREVLRRSEEFLPTNALVSVTPLSAEARRILSRARFALPPILASATGEQHRTVRRLVAGFFTPAKVGAVFPHIVDLTRHRARLAAPALADGPIDLVRAVARHVPPAIMESLTGIANPDLDTLNRWSKDSLELFWGWPDPPRQRELAHSAAEFYTWLRETVDAHPDDSLFGTLQRAGLTTTEICSLGYFLLIAGQETTTQLIGVAYYRALQTPRLWATLAAGGSASGFVRGILAADSSVPAWRRTAASATTLGGTAIPAGAEILLELTGHHPPDAAPTAYTLAFGHGVHRCLGARLAELEATTVLEQTARALPHLALHGPAPAWQRLLSFRTPTTVLVTASSP